MGRSLFLALSLLCLVAVGAAEVFSLSGRAQPAATGSIISVQSPAQINAGESAAVTVTLDHTSNGQTVNLVLQTTFGPRIFSQSATNNGVMFTIPPQATRISGTVTLIATLGHSSAQRQMIIAPGLPAEPLTPLVGARSIVADGKSWSMVVLVPRDALGNPVADGVPVNLRVNHPAGPTPDQALTVEHLLAWARVTSGLVAGKTTVAVSSGAAHGPEASIVEVAGWPATFSVSAFPSPIPADGRSVTMLKTSYMVDLNGNAVTDGTLVTFIVHDELGGERRIPAIVVGGVAQASLTAPSRSTTLDVWATVFAVESTHIRVAFSDPSVKGATTASVKLDPARSVVVIESGPWLSSLGQYAPDGLPVTFTVTSGTRAVITVRTNVRDGHATAELRLADLPPGSYAVEATLGSASGSATFEIPPESLATSAATPSLP